MKVFGALQKGCKIFLNELKIELANCHTNVQEILVVNNDVFKVERDFYAVPDCAWYALILDYLAFWEFDAASNNYKKWLV